MGRVLVRLVLAAVALTTVVGVWGVFEARRARADLERSRALVTQLRSTSDPDRTEVLRTLGEAAAAAESARRHANSPGLVVAARLPVLGRSFTAVRNVAHAAAAVVASADHIARDLSAAQLLRDGRVDVAELRRIAAELDTMAGRTAGPVDRLLRTRTALTPPVVGRSVHAAQEELAGTPGSLARTARLLSALAGIAGADGERDILVVLQNNAELRGTGGLISVFATANINDGVFRLGRFQDVSSVSDAAAVAKRVPAPPDYTEIYGPYLANTTLWKNANMSPSGPDSLSVLAAVAGRSLTTRPTAVIALDVPAIASILRAVGPVDLPDGRRATATTVLDELLVEAYANVPDTPAGQKERRRLLRQTADGIIQRLLRGGDTVVLARGLQSAATGRHVMLWSAVAAEQAALVDAGAAGHLPDGDDDLVNVTVQNLGSGDREGNKLDYYTERTVRVHVEVEGDSVVTTQVVSLRNAAPKNVPLYVAGRTNPGQSNNLVTMAVPADAQLLAFERDGAPQSTRFLREGNHTVLPSTATLERGEQTSWTLRYRTTLGADGEYRLRLVPQPLAKPATLAVDLDLPEALSGVDLPAHEWDAVREVVVTRERPGWWERTRERARRFWQEPVRVG